MEVKPYSKCKINFQQNKWRFRISHFPQQIHLLFLLFIFSISITIHICNNVIIKFQHIVYIRILKSFSDILVFPFTVTVPVVSYFFYTSCCVVLAMKYCENWFENYFLFFFFGFKKKLFEFFFNIIRLLEQRMPLFNI